MNTPWTLGSDGVEFWGWAYAQWLGERRRIAGWPPGEETWEFHRRLRSDFLAQGQGLRWWR